MKFMILLAAAYLFFVMIFVFFFHLLSVKCSLDCDALRSMI